MPEWLRMAKLVVVVSAVSIGTSFQFGFGTGVLNNLEHIAPASLAAAGTPLHLWQWSLIVSGFGLGGLIGSCVVAHVSLRFGRKTVLLATNAFVVASSALLMMGTSWPVLLLGRICTGLVAGSKRCTSQVDRETQPPIARSLTRAARVLSQLAARSSPCTSPRSRPQTSAAPSEPPTSSASPSAASHHSR